MFNITYKFQLSSNYYKTIKYLKSVLKFMKANFLAIFLSSLLFQIVC